MEWQAGMLHLLARSYGHVRMKVQKLIWRLPVAIVSIYLISHTVPTTTGVNDFTAKITATNLKPDTPYHYRWIAGNSSSEVGMFITAPLDDQVADVHFSWSGDTDPSRNGSNYYFGNWNAFQSALSERPQFFIYLGDTIYSDLRGNNGDRSIIS